MFYLLENNKIIETNSAEWYCGRLKVILNEEERYKYNNHISWNLKDGFYKYFTVKNQSENVFDLIEEGDLLYMPFDCNGAMVHRFDMFKCYKYNAFHCSIHIVHEKGIFAVYKPDDKGNYIKVWERKEEDD